MGCTDDKEYLRPGPHAFEDEKISLGIKPRYLSHLDRTLVNTQTAIPAPPRHATKFNLQTSRLIKVWALLLDLKCKDGDTFASQYALFTKWGRQPVHCVLHLELWAAPLSIIPLLYAFLLACLLDLSFSLLLPSHTVPRPIRNEPIQSGLGENCALLGCYAVSSGNFLPTFRYNLSVLSSGFKNSKESL
jgi:hypothetical protein